MTERDELREKIIKEIGGWELACDEDIEFVADRILALLPPQPKLEWREHDEWGAAYFYMGALRVGEARKDGGVWHAWAGGFRYGFFDARDEAKRAVEQAVRKELGMSHG